MIIENGSPPVSQDSVTLLALDENTWQLQDGMMLKLNGYSCALQDNKIDIVVPNGANDTPDQFNCRLYGTVRQLKNGTFMMWYSGYGKVGRGPDPKTGKISIAPGYRIMVATSTDGKVWKKPSLGLLSYQGSTNNNLVVFKNSPELPHSTGPLGKGDLCTSAACVVIYDPEAADPNKVFKMAVECGDGTSGHRIRTAYSADGLTWDDKWQPSLKLEPSGGEKLADGRFVINGQGGSAAWSSGRCLSTYVSYDFERWFPTTCMGFSRTPFPPMPLCDNPGLGQQGITLPHAGEQVHLGASLLDYGSCVLGVYGQWHGDSSDDRNWLKMDLGLIVSSDGLHFREPVRDFRLVSGAELKSAGPDGAPLPPSKWPQMRLPQVVQGQGFLNTSTETLVFYSGWGHGDGVRLASWPRDRVGGLTPFLNIPGCNVVSAPINTQGKALKLTLNAVGQATVQILTEDFKPVPGFTHQECVVLDDHTSEAGCGSTIGLSRPVSWQGGSAEYLEPTDHLRPREGPGSEKVRIEVRFTEKSGQLFAVYASHPQQHDAKENDNKHAAQMAASIVAKHTDMIPSDDVHNNNSESSSFAVDATTGGGGGNDDDDDDADADDDDGEPTVIDAVNDDGDELQLHKLIEASAQRSLASKNDVLGKLQELKCLFEDDFLTKDEFRLAKQRILQD